MKLPDGYEAHIVPRSSTFKNYHIIQTNNIGIVDNSYCGENDEWKIYTISAFYNVINPYTPILTYPYYPTFEPYTICKTQH